MTYAMIILLTGYTMSYDLYFKGRDSQAKFKLESVRGFFDQRKNYQLTDAQAIYQNSVTGVYFSFDFEETTDGEPSEALPVTFCLNFYRPHIFGLEAELEVRAFVKALNLFVSDPHIGGMGEGEYSTEGFLAGWNIGNRFAYSAVSQGQPDLKPLVLATTQIETCWRWNFAITSLQERLGDQVFVPRYMFVEHEGKAVRMIVWPDGIPTAIPESDVIAIPRKSILGKRFFGPKEDVMFVLWNDVQPLLEQFPRKMESPPYYFLSYSEVPVSVTEWIRKISSGLRKPTGVAIDKILNLELMEEARKRVQ